MKKLVISVICLSSLTACAPQPDVIFVETPSAPRVIRQTTITTTNVIRSQNERIRSDSSCLSPARPDSGLAKQEQRIRADLEKIGVDQSKIQQEIIRFRLDTCHLK